jgi:hypothetical protein
MNESDMMGDFYRDTIRVFRLSVNKIDGYPNNY